MPEFQFKNQVGIRYSDEETKFINDNLHLFINDVPDIDQPGAARRIMFHVFEIAVKSLTNSNATNENTEKLEKQVADLLLIQDQNRLTIDTLSQQVEQLTNESNLSVENYGKTINETIESYEQKIKNITENPQKLMIDLDGKTFTVLEAFRRKLSDYTKSEITMGAMVLDLFWKYIFNQDTQIAFPFFYRKSQIVKMMEEVE